MAQRQQSVQKLSNISPTALRAREVRVSLLDTNPLAEMARWRCVTRGAAFYESGWLGRRASVIEIIERRVIAAREPAHQVLELFIHGPVRFLSEDAACADGLHVYLARTDLTLL